jgi:hypothetical protein
MAPRTFFTVVTFNFLVLFFIVALAVLWRRPQFWIYSLVLFVGAFVGPSTVWTNDMIVPVFLLLAFSSFAGFAQPRKVWLLAFLLAMWVPVATLLAMVVGAIPLNAGGVLNSCFAFVPASIGGGLGFLLNRAAGNPVLSVEIGSVRTSP